MQLWKREVKVCEKVIDTVMADASNNLDLYQVRETDHKVSPL